MAIYLTNRDGGKTDEEGHYQFLASGFTGNVLDGLTLVQQNPLSMKLNLTAGNARIPYGGYAYTAYVKAGQTHEVQIGTANPSNPRIDRVVLYVDRTEARQVVTPNNPDIVKVAVVAGTPAGTPTRPSDANVNTAVSNNPWIDLADVRVNTGVTQITTANVTDKRVMASAVLAPNAVTADKIDFTTLTLGYAQITSNFVANSVSGDVVVTGLSTTVTIPSGGANIKITFWASNIIGSNTGYYYRQAIKEGGTTLSHQQFKNAGGEANLVTMYRGFATAGTHTYSAAVGVGASANITISAGSTSPAFILVEMA